MVALDERIRESKAKPKKPREEEKQSPTKSELGDLNKRIKILKDALSSDERVGKRMVTDAESSAKAVQEELAALKERLKSKEEESQLKDIKIREL